MGLLDGKTLLVTGVLMDSSIAFHVAKLAQEQGATVILTSFGRTMKITQTIAKRLPTTPVVVELDVANQEHLDTLADRLREHTDHLDGVLHSIGFAPQGAFTFLDATWEDVSTAIQVSAYSLKALAVAAAPLMGPGGSIVGLTFDARYAGFHKRRELRRHHHRRDIAGEQLDGIDHQIDTHFVQHGHHGLNRELAADDLIARPVETDDQSIPDQLVFAHAFDRGHILDSNSLS